MVVKFLKGNILFLGRMIVKSNVMGISNNVVVIMDGCFIVRVVFNLIYIL